jgi:gliding motility-associated-like protein
MRKFQWLAFMLFSSVVYEVNAQTNFVFNCAKDDTATCTSNCITVRAKVPDVHAQTTDYVVNPAAGNSCFVPAVAPETPGTPTTLTTDDKYSTLIDIPFSFRFYDDPTPYTQLLVSTNGYICFDPGEESGFSHFGILNGSGFLSATSGTPQDLPSDLYDRSVIFGPYHDINPNYTTSPDRQIKYDVIGTAPHRKFVVSFYKIPLFGTAYDCDTLIENTHQIVLYEGINVIEVFINSVQQCDGWNEGRSMIGLQNYNRDKAIMAPGRAASDAPWGTPGMNEIWRFVPAGGPSLFRGVELYDVSGNLVATGDSVASSNGDLEVEFLDVCSQSGNNLYVVKSKYENSEVPGTYVYGTDTLNIFVPDPLVIASTTTTNVDAYGASTGAITITAAGTGTYQYVIDGGTPQSNGNFTGLAAGDHQIVISEVSGEHCPVDTTINLTQPPPPPCVKVRNAFSPNGDGFNEFWKVYDDRSCLSNVTVNVFNRNGSKVFESKNYQNEWKGTYNGKPVPDGTYYGVAEFTLLDGRKLKINTDITIIR